MAYTPNPGPGTGTTTPTKGANSYFNVLGPDPLAQALETFINEFSARYGWGKIVGEGAKKYTIEQRYDQMLALATKYSGFRDQLGGFLKNWDPSLGGKKGNYTASGVAFRFKNFMEAAQNTPAGKGKSNYTDLSDYLWATAPAAVTEQFSTGSGKGASTGTAQTFADMVLRDLGLPITAASQNKMLQWMGSEENAGGWSANGNPLNTGQTTDAKGKPLKIVGTSSAGFPIYASLAVAASATAATLLTGSPNYHYGAILSNLKDNGSPAAFATAVEDSSWAGGHYGYGKNWNSQGLPGNSAIVGSYWSGTTSSSGLPTVDSIIASTANATARAVYTATSEAYNQGATQSKDYSSYETVHAELYDWGLQSLAHWAWQKSQKGEDATQIVLDMRKTPQYAERFPGLVEREKKGLPPISENQYIAYQNEMMSFANTIALPKGFITPKEVGTLVANDVSPQEFSQRLTSLQSVALKASPTVRAEFSRYFGVRGGLGALTAYFADPHRATGLLTEQVNQAMIGAEAINSGFGQLSKAHALQLAQDEASGKIALGTSRSDLDKAAEQLYLTSGAPGSVANRVSKNTLLGQYVPGYNGTKQAVAQQGVRNAENARASFLEAGGGFAATARGVRGAGGAATEGTPNT